MPDPVDGIKTVASGVKVATAIDHIKNNRIEYLILLVISHMLGFTSIVIAKAQGVCI